MQFHLRGLFFVTFIAALIAFAVRSPPVGVPVLVLGVPVLYRWQRWSGTAIQAFQPVDRAIEMIFTLWVSIGMEICLQSAAVVAGAAALVVVLAATSPLIILAGLGQAMFVAACAAGLAAYLAVYCGCFRATLWQ